MRGIFEFLVISGITVLIVLSHVALQTHQPLLEIVARLIALF